MSRKITETYFQRFHRLMALEAEAEKEQLQQLLARQSAADLERSGNALINLVIQEEAAGLGGRFLITLSKRNQTENLPWHRLGIGTPVLLSEEMTANSPAWRGIVSRQDKRSLQVALDNLPEPTTEPATFRLDLASDEVTRRRQLAALDEVEAARGNRLAELRQVLLGQQPALFQRDDVSFKPLDESLDSSQLEAVHFALTADDVAIIHGPPGTGKTTTVVELIRQAVRQGERVLACAPSNLAVDNLFERLLAAGEKVLRLGHPARVLPELRHHTLDVLVENHPDMRVAQRLVREAYALRDKASRYTRAKPAAGEKQALRQEAKSMLADAQRIEKQTIERLLYSADILCVTNTGLNEAIIGSRTFDLCVMDEAGQATEPGAWLPLIRSQRVVLAGDHFQLPPTIISVEAANQGLGVSLMERLMNQSRPSNPAVPERSRQLTVQYRMHEAIMDFSSAQFYEKTLTAHPSVAEHLLRDLPGVTDTELTSTPVHFIDTAGASYDEEVEPEGDSRLNPGEAELVCRKVTALLEAGVSPADMAVITPYSAQVRHLLELLPQPELEINSVDGFQGREKEAIIISLVRANPEGEIGFLADTRRLNVALTRARRKLIVIGDSATITVHPFYQQLVQYFEAIGAYHSVWEEL